MSRHLQTDAHTGWSDIMRDGYMKSQEDALDIAEAEESEMTEGYLTVESRTLDEAIAMEQRMADEFYEASRAQPGGDRLMESLGMNCDTAASTLRTVANHQIVTPERKALIRMANTDCSVSIHPCTERSIVPLEEWCAACWAGHIVKEIG